MATIESVQMSLHTADEWEKKGQFTWVSKCLTSALMGLLHIAVSQFGDAVEGVLWLKDQDFVSVLRRTIATLNALSLEVTAGRWPNSVIGGNYHVLVFAHAAWCLEEFELGETLVDFANKDDVTELSTPFWREYARALTNLVHRASYHANPLRLHGQERYWIAYIHMIEAACAGIPLETQISEAATAFSARNKDKRIKDDSYEIEGSGAMPVRWDFRSHGLLSYISTRR